MQALIDPSHIEHQKQEQKAAGLQGNVSNEQYDFDGTPQSNESLVKDGKVIVTNHCKKFVEKSWPSVPIECIT